jgi:hypothetical protein
VALWRYAIVQDITPIELGMCLLLMVTFASTIGATLFFLAQLFFVAKVVSAPESKRASRAGHHHARVL